MKTQIKTRALKPKRNDAIMLVIDEAEKLIKDLTIELRSVVTPFTNLRAAGLLRVSSTTIQKIRQDEHVSANTILKMAKRIKYLGNKK